MRTERTRLVRHAAGAVAVLAVMAGALAAMGRVWWCRAGDPHLWSGADEILSRHNSQHLVDPYAFTHVLHGLVFYALVWVVLRGRAGATGRAWAGFLLEVAWEILENTDAVIGRYRTATIALDYYGDSIANSVADVVAYLAGYGLAAVLPVQASVAAFVLVDGALALWIRDGLVLNVWMLLWPIAAVLRWQSGG
ncbi:MAG: DUF2585 family protein [Deltaproteobacteria bacterium]|nr:DUF2585 family protein [Deltaproteobacteria bacterium]